MHNSEIPSGGIMRRIWKESFNVHTYEVDALGRLSLPLLGSLLQEAASRHAMHLGWGYQSLIMKDCIWVLTALKIQLDQDLRWNDRVIIRTWPSGRNKFFYFRDFTIENQNRVIFGNATTNWMIIDRKSRRPARPEIPETFDYATMKNLFDSQPHKWPVIETLIVQEVIQVRFDDLDINRHVNNIRYLDWMMRSIASDFRKRHRLKCFEIHFLSEATEQNEIGICLQQNGTELQHLLKQMQTGKAVSQAKSVWEPLQ
jgi:medium-chain acyl-[acyl-carrier-protein] hydrolase